MDELTLHRHLDGRLDDRERRDVEDVLRNDPAARRQLDALREEARLISTALDIQSEPSRRLGDKVIAQLHTEERSRHAALRTRKLFRQGLSAAALAAALMLCFFLVKPRNPAGSIVSGSNATVVVHGEEREATSGTRVYDGDELVTGKGQFVRFVLASGTILDVDENSKLSVQRGGANTVLRLTRGRTGVAVGEGQPALTVETPRASTVFPSGTIADLWLPEKSAALWPGIFYPLDHFSNLQSVESPTATDTPALITVLKGVARVYLGKSQEPTPVLEGVRASITQSEFTQKRVSLSGSRVLETRSTFGPHLKDGKAARSLEWTHIGLLDRPNFETLGRRLGFMTNSSSQVIDALKQIDAAMQEKTFSQRAEKIAAAQQAFHLAYETFQPDDVRRRFGLTLEGLAHFEEGRARYMNREAAANDALASFEASRAAFDGALAVGKNVKDNPSLEWRAAFAGGETPAMSDLSPEAQSALLSEFHRAAALHWKVRSMLADKRIILDSEEAAVEAELIHRGAEEAADSFVKVRENLGHSVESLTCLLGETLSEQLVSGENQRRKAIDGLQILAAKPLAGGEASARAHFEGVRQAALLELVRLNALGHEDREAAKTLDAAHDFALLYPLETRSAAAQAVKSELKKGLENLAASALKAKRFEHAVEACDTLLVALDEIDGAVAETSEVRHLGVHLDLLEALVGAQDWPRARREIAVLDGRVPEDLHTRYNALRAQVNAPPKK